MFHSNFHLILLVWTFLSISINRVTPECLYLNDHSTFYSDWMCDNMTISNDTLFKNVENFNNTDVDNLGFTRVTGELHSSILKNFTNLKRLFIRDSRLEKFELNSSKLKSLMIKRTVLPDNSTFTHCSNLEKITLNSVSGLSLENKGFYKLKKLKSLDITFVKIEHITKNTFKGLHNLKTLSLINNSIATIEEDSFADMLNLKELYIEDSNLRYISQEALKPLRKLTSLTIYGENLDILSLEMFNNQKKLTAIGLPFKTWRDIDVERIPETFPELAFLSFKEVSMSHTEKEYIRKKHKQLIALLIKEKNR